MSILERLERLALDRNCLARDAAEEIKRLQAVIVKASKMAKLFLEIHGVDKERLDGYGPGEVDLQLLAEELANTTQPTTRG